MQFFISASGCKGKITAQMQSSMEHAAIIRRMTEEFDEVTFAHHNKFLKVICLSISIKLLLAGKRRISDDYVWPTVEEVSGKFLRLRSNTCEAVSIFNHL